MRKHILMLLSTGLVLSSCASPDQIQVDDARAATTAMADEPQAQPSEAPTSESPPSQERLETAARAAVEKGFSVASQGAIKSPIGDVASVTFSQAVEGQEVMISITQSLPNEEGWLMLLDDIGAREEEGGSPGFRMAVVEREDLVQVAILSPDGVLTNAHAGALLYRAGQPRPVSRERLTQIAQEIAEATR